MICEAWHVYSAPAMRSRPLPTCTVGYCRPIGKSVADRQRGCRSCGATYIVSGFAAHLSQTVVCDGQTSSKDRRNFIASLFRFGIACWSATSLRKQSGNWMRNRGKGLMESKRFSCSIHGRRGNLTSRKSRAWKTVFG